MEASISPLTPVDCDLRDFTFMPLDVARLRDSDLASDETPEACWAAVLLWCAAWHQVPAASVPDNDQWLAKQAGYVSRGKVSPEWAKVRDGAMRGFVKCTDGRYYHPVIAEKALDAWESKLDQRWRNECGRIKKHNERHGTRVARPSFSEWMSLGCPQGQRLHVPSDSPATTEGHVPPVTEETAKCPEKVPRDTRSKGEREGQGEGQGDKENTGANAPSSADKLPPCRPEAIVQLYHEVLPELPAVRVMDKARERAIRARWQWVLTSKKPDGSRRASSAAEALEWFRSYFGLARENDFLMGRTPKTPGHENWRPDIEYLMKSAGLKQVIEKTTVEAA